MVKCTYQLYFKVIRVSLLLLIIDSMIIMMPDHALYRVQLIDFPQPLYLLSFDSARFIGMVAERLRSNNAKAICLRKNIHSKKG